MISDFSKIRPGQKLRTSGAGIELAGRRYFGECRYVRSYGGAPVVEIPPQALRDAWVGSQDYLRAAANDYLYRPRYAPFRAGAAYLLASPVELEEIPEAATVDLIDDIAACDWKIGADFSRMTYTDRTVAVSATPPDLSDLVAAYKLLNKNSMNGENAVPSPYELIQKKQAETIAQPWRTLRAAGIVDSNHVLTPEGQRVFLNFMFGDNHAKDLATFIENGQEKARGKKKGA